MMSRFLIRLVLVSLLYATISVPALAQYGGGGSGGGTTPGDVYTSPNGGYDSAKVAAVAAAAAGAAVLYFVTRNRALVGCIEPGPTLFNEKGRYLLTGKTDLLTGKKAALKGRRLKNDAGKHSFEVQKVKYLGDCGSTATKAN